MNNRLKFRAWDGESMIEDTGIPHSTYFHTGPSLIYMQCTGLNDKNGKLIYEGDIVRYIFETFEGRIEVVAVLTWIIEQAKFVCEQQRVIEDTLSLGGPQTSYPVQSAYCEVIGNIWENESPNLLT